MELPAAVRAWKISGQSRRGFGARQRVAVQRHSEPVQRIAVHGRVVRQFRECPGNTQTAQQILTSVDILGGHGIGANGASYFNPLAFAPVTSVNFGDSGRDFPRGPGVFNVNGSLFRNFRLTERFQLQFRAEVFNLTNTAQFGLPGATVTSATFNADGSVKSLNGFTQITSASNERQLRFALRLSF